jgi:hypothetical protein
MGDSMVLLPSGGIPITNRPNRNDVIKGFEAKKNSVRSLMIVVAIANADEGATN